MWFAARDRVSWHGAIPARRNGLQCMSNAE
jgi:hypothetical protein